MGVHVSGLAVFIRPPTPSCALGSGRKLSSSESTALPGSHLEPESAPLGPVIHFQNLSITGTLEPDSLVSNPTSWQAVGFGTDCYPLCVMVSSAITG